MKKIEVVVDDRDLTSVLNAIQSAARMTPPGSSKIFVYDVKRSLSIHPDEEDAVYEEETFDVGRFLRSHQHEPPA